MRSGSPTAPKLTSRWLNNIFAMNAQRRRSQYGVKDFTVRNVRTSTFAKIVSTAASMTCTLWKKWRLFASLITKPWCAKSKIRYSKNLLNTTSDQSTFQLYIPSATAPHSSLITKIAQSVYKSSQFSLTPCPPKALLMPFPWSTYISVFSILP